MTGKQIIEEALRIGGIRETLYGRQCIVLPPKEWDKLILLNVREKDRFYWDDLFSSSVMHVIAGEVIGSPTVAICRGYEHGFFPRIEAHPEKP